MATYSWATAPKSKSVVATEALSSDDAPDLEGLNLFAPFKKDDILLYIVKLLLVYRNIKDCL